MAADGDWWVVMSAGAGLLGRARKLLSARGIASRSSRPRRAEGLLRVRGADAERARALLRDELGPEVVVGGEDAKWFRCHACDAPLSLGAKTCRACGALSLDPHGC